MLLRSEAFTRGIPKEWRAWRILYTTTRDENAPAVASGLVIASDHLPAGPRPVIAWAHGTTGPGPVIRHGHVEPWLARGGCAAFHDYATWPGVTALVDELTGSGGYDLVRRGGSMVVLQRR